MDTNKCVFFAGWGVMDSNAHMANTAYLDMAADCRLTFFARNGFSGSEFAKRGIGPVVRKDEIEYMKEFRLMDEVHVELLLAGISDDGSRFRFRNIFRNSAGKVATVVTTTAGWLDLNKRALVCPPEDLQRIMVSLPRTDDFEQLSSSVS